MKSAFALDRVLRVASICFVGFFVAQWIVIDPHVHFENHGRTPYYANSKGQGVWAEMAKALDVCAVDGCLDRFRPLGFLTELFDAKMIVLLNQWIPFYFRPISHFILIFVFGFSLRWALIQLLGVQRKTLATFFASSMLVTPQILVYSTFYFRPGKFYAAIAAALLLGHWWKSRLAPLRKPYPYKESAVLGVLAMGDEQVALAAAVVFVIAAVDRHLLRKHEPHRGLGRMSATMAAIMGGGGLFLFLRMTLGSLIHSYLLTGKLQSYTNPLEWFKWNPNNLSRAYQNTLWMHESMLGNRPDVSILSVILFGVLLVWLLRRPKGAAPFSGRVRYGALLAGYLSIVLLIFLLATRHPYIFSFDIKRTGYYFICFTVLFFGVLISILYSRGVFEDFSKTRALVIAWILLSLVNMGSLSKTLQVTYSNHMGYGVEIGRLLIRQARGQELTPFQASLPFIWDAPFFRDFFYKHIAEPGRWATKKGQKTDAH